MDRTPAQSEVLRLLGERGRPVHAQDLLPHVEGLNLSGVQFALTMLERKGLAVSAKHDGEYMPSWTLLPAGRVLAAQLLDRQQGSGRLCDFKRWVRGASP